MIPHNNSIVITEQENYKICHQDRLYFAIKNHRETSLSLGSRGKNFALCEAFIFLWSNIIVCILVLCKHSRFLTKQLTADSLNTLIDKQVQEASPLSIFLTCSPQLLYQFFN